MDGWRPSDRPRTRTKGGQFAPETERRDDGKWETAARADDSMRASSLLEPAFDLHFLARDSGSLTPPGTALALPYTLLVSVKAPVGVALYDRIRQTTPLLSPLVVPVDVPIEV
jgi:hypothetical protein